LATLQITLYATFVSPSHRIIAKLIRVLIP